MSDRSNTRPAAGHVTNALGANAAPGLFAGLKIAHRLWLMVGLSALLFAIAVVVGTKVNDIRIGYSYDITISRLAANRGGAHELTAVYEIASRARRKSMAKRRVVPCAKF